MSYQPEGRDKYPGGAVWSDRCPTCRETLFHLIGCTKRGDRDR